MKTIDRLLQAWRHRVTAPWIPAQTRLLDIGCHEGELIFRLAGRLAHGLGIDPRAPNRSGSHWELSNLAFGPHLAFKDRAFDTITLIATAEHLTSEARSWQECRRLLVPGGRFIVTIPNPLVDRIVNFLLALHVADGMEVHQHNGLRPGDLKDEVMAAGFSLEHHETFQFGLNNLFVFRS